MVHLPDTCLNVVPDPMLSFSMKQKQIVKLINITIASYRVAVQKMDAV